MVGIALGLAAVVTSAVGPELVFRSDTASDIKIVYSADGVLSVPQHCRLDGASRPCNLSYGTSATV